MTTLKRVGLIFAAGFVLMQFVRFDKTNPASNPAHELKAEEKVTSILKNSCYDCHSNNTQWPIYSEIAPVSWIVTKHVADARKWLNFSEWESYDEAKKLKLRKLIYREVAEAMPLQSYSAFHEKAVLTNEQKKTLREWSGIKAADVSMRD
jgi:hypothetical protein